MAGTEPGTGTEVRLNNFIRRQVLTEAQCFDSIGYITDIYHGGDSSGGSNGGAVDPGTHSKGGGSDPKAIDPGTPWILPAGFNYSYTLAIYNNGAHYPSAAFIRNGNSYKQIYPSIISTSIGTIHGTDTQGELIIEMQSSYAKLYSWNGTSHISMPKTYIFPGIFNVTYSTTYNASTYSSATIPSFNPATNTDNTRWAYIKNNVISIRDPKLKTYWFPKTNNLTLYDSTDTTYIKHFELSINTTLASNLRTSYDTTNYPLAYNNYRSFGSVASKYLPILRRQGVNGPGRYFNCTYVPSNSKVFEFYLNRKEGTKWKAYPFSNSTYIEIKNYWLDSTLAVDDGMGNDYYDPSNNNTNTERNLTNIYVENEYYDIDEGYMEGPHLDSTGKVTTNQNRVKIHSTIARRDSEVPETHSTSVPPGQNTGTTHYYGTYFLNGFLTNFFLIRLPANTNNLGINVDSKAFYSFGNRMMIYNSGVGNLPKWIYDNADVQVPWSSDPEDTYMHLYGTTDSGGRTPLGHSYFDLPTNFNIQDYPRPNVTFSKNGGYDLTGVTCMIPQSNESNWQEVSLNSTVDNPYVQIYHRWNDRSHSGQKTEQYLDLYILPNIRFNLLRSSKISYVTFHDSYNYPILCYMDPISSTMTENGDVYDINIKYKNEWGNKRSMKTINAISMNSSGTGSNSITTGAYSYYWLGAQLLIPYIRHTETDLHDYNICHMTNQYHVHFKKYFTLYGSHNSYIVARCTGSSSGSIEIIRGNSNSANNWVISEGTQHDK